MEVERAERQSESSPATSPTSHTWTNNSRSLSNGQRAMKYSRKRAEQLSIPKQSMRADLTSFPNPIRWGNQTAITPINPAALKAEPSARTSSLAMPKKDFLNPERQVPSYDVGSVGRESAIWQVSTPAKSAEASQRVESLAQHKTELKAFTEKQPREMHEVGSCGRVSPVWEVSQAAQKCEDRQHTLELAQPKKPHKSYEVPRTDHCIVSEAAKRAKATARTEQLAEPKNYAPGTFREPEWVVSGAARKADATERVCKLAEARGTAEGYRPCRKPIWKVHESTLHAFATPRLDELAVPIKRETMDHVQFNPDAFNVPPNALKARATARLEELAQPTDRK